MRIGIVCPYSFDVAGGVQNHTRDLAHQLHTRGHHVAVLAPAAETTPHTRNFTSAGSSRAIPYNGSIARLAFGPAVANRVTTWLENGRFDILHIHEPLVPSTSILALRAARTPIVATFHTNLERSLAIQAVSPLVRSSLEKIHGRIAVSQAARQTALNHMGIDSVIIPNGVDTHTFATATPNPTWTGTPNHPTIAFLGRIDEPRKGLPVLADALPHLLKHHPGLRLLIAGHGDIPTARNLIPTSARHAAHFLGAIPETDKAALLRSVDAYIAPHTGGESFGIVLVEAMSAGAPVIASNLTPFTHVLGDAGITFPTGNSHALAQALTNLLHNPKLREKLHLAGLARAATYDWRHVSDDILAVYETVLEGTRATPLTNTATALWATLKATLTP
ncbi:GDP-mannose-dependent alpha-(1-2)-phosphatidylinositol mannosyltransferase [Dermatophilus congolensis]|uniref:D-inositol 3-phosphate glycosyltransferase n=1 Tax=Dermatophilus congolensis TaxID=1863 RepID=A0AA46BMU1_9MICO|nr:glycosyltransferase family 4 protein [Dermatophilus congolensis]STD08366.1 GDP-mannose-dependent alpha-(1-2)-phosphatidylinositol mannosyltransferase [Dermatophilus congolensis]